MPYSLKNNITYITNIKVNNQELAKVPLNNDQGAHVQSLPRTKIKSRLKNFVIKPCNTRLYTSTTTASLNGG